MSSLEGKEFLTIEQRFGFLKSVGPRDIACRYPTCKKQATEMQRYEHVSSRDAVLHQDPHHPSYGAIFKRWITLSLCNKHQKEFNRQCESPTRLRDTNRMHENVGVVVEQLKQYFLADCRWIAHLPGSWPNNTDGKYPDNVTPGQLDRALAAYRTRFEPSCQALMPVNSTRKTSCSFRALITKSLRDKELKNGWLYMFYNDKIAEHEEQVVKIGFSKETPESRIRCYGQNCNLLALENGDWKGFKKVELSFVPRVESLIHYELRHYGHAILYDCAGHGSKTKEHQEFFKVSWAVAKSTVDHWTAWVSKKGCEPYDEHGQFQAWSHVYSPNVSSCQIKNEFLLDSRGCPWYTHGQNDNSISTYSKCEAWTTCTCPPPLLRAIGIDSTQSQTSPRVASSDQRRSDKDDPSIGVSNAAIDFDSRLRPSTSGFTTPPRSRKTNRRTNCITTPPTPPSLSFSCSTPSPALPRTPLDTEYGMRDVTDSQDSYKTALEEPNPEGWDEDLERPSHSYMAVPFKMIATDSESHGKSERDPPTSKARRRTSQAMSNRCLLPPPAPEPRRRSVSGSNIA